MDASTQHNTADPISCIPQKHAAFHGDDRDPCVVLAGLNKLTTTLALTKQTTVWRCRNRFFVRMVVVVVFVSWFLRALRIGGSGLSRSTESEPRIVKSFFDRDSSVLTSSSMPFIAIRRASAGPTSTRYTNHVSNKIQLCSPETIERPRAGTEKDTVLLRDRLTNRYSQHHTTQRKPF